MVWSAQSAVRSNCVCCAFGIATATLNFLASADTIVSIASIIVKSSLLFIFFY